MNALPYTLYVSFAGALGTLALGGARPRMARWMALLTALTSWTIGLVAAATYVPNSRGLERIVDVPWIPSLGIHYTLAADGVSLTLIILTGLAATAGILFSWNIEHRCNEFFALYLTLIGGVYGVFLSGDAFLFFVFYEVAIVPKYFLVAIWGSKERAYGAMKLVLYSFVGSSLVLVGLLWAYSASDSGSFGLDALASASAHLSQVQQTGIFAFVFTGFAILAGIFPLHTWAPTGHVAAPTAASMLLAGVVMKLGAYACLRIALPLFPLGLAFWQPVIGWLALIGIIYAGFIALIQEDFKYVIGYSSVSHMGFVLLGLAVCNLRSLGGAVLQMFSHGVIAGLLFAVVGRLVYDRTHTRSIPALRRFQLARSLPFAATIFVVAGLASMGLPGFSGFPAELSILIGTWQHNPIWAIGAAVGVVVAAAFTLRVIQLVFFSPLPEPAEPPIPLPAISWPEKTGALLLVGAAVVVGLKPGLLLDWIGPALQSPYFHSLLTGVSS